MRNKKINIKSTPFFPLFPRSSLSLHSKILSLPWAVQWGCVWGCYSQYITVPLCLSFLLTLFFYCGMGSPWVTVLSGISTCSVVDPPQATVDICSTMDHLLLLLWIWCYLCCFSLFLLPPLLAVQCFLPFLKYIFPEITPDLLTGSAVSCSIRHWLLPTETTSAALTPAATKTLLPTHDSLILHFQKYNCK